MPNPLDPRSLHFEPTSIMDSAGRVFYHGGRVFRSVADPDAAELFQEILDADWCEELFQAGLVKTWIPEDIAVSGAELVLEHERIAFQSHPCEHTSLMHWQAALAFVNIAMKLAQRGFALADAHPWNLMFHRGRPVFVDFGSITRGQRFSAEWLREFYLYFMAPIWLASSRLSRLAPAYRREHRNGFGLKLMSFRLIRRAILGIGGRNRGSTKTLNHLESWLKRHQPRTPHSGPWSGYEQAHGASSGSEPATVKQQFVLKILQSCKPTTVLDCAANKGFYAFMAAREGASVAAFDLQSDCVDEILSKALADGLDVTPAVMDFLVPTPPFGLGLTGKSAFQRYRCDMVLALGLVHHICLSQQLPLELFCHICSRFARRHLIIEFVHLDDKHLQNWEISDVTGYGLPELLECFSSIGWSERARVELQDSGLSRTMLHLRHPSKARGA